MSKRRWFTMTAANGEAEILIYDEIGPNFFGLGGGLSAKDFDAELRALGAVKAITLRVNSPGGDAVDSIAVFNMLERHPAKITVMVDGLAASGASLVAMAGDRIVMPENTFMVVHEARGVAIGTADDMLALAADLERISASYLKVYADRTGSDAKAIEALMAEDRLMTAAEAKERGFADEVTPAIKVAASFDLDRVPERLRAMVKAAMGASEPAAPVVNLDDVRAAARRQTSADAVKIMNMCKLANMSMEFARDLIAANKTIKQASAAIQDRRVADDEATAVNHHHAAPSGHEASAGKRGWDKIIEHYNANPKSP